MVLILYTFMRMTSPNVRTKTIKYTYYVLILSCYNS